MQLNDTANYLADWGYWFECNCFLNLDNSVFPNKFHNQTSTNYANICWFIYIYVRLSDVESLKVFLIYTKGHPGSNIYSKSKKKEANGERISMRSPTRTM